MASESKSIHQVPLCFEFCFLVKLRFDFGEDDLWAVEEE